MDFFRINKIEQCHWTMYLVTLLFAGVGTIIGQFISLFIGMYLGVNPLDLSGFPNKNIVFFIQIFPFSVGLIGMLFSIHFFHKRNFLTAITARNQFDWSRFFFAILIWLLVLTVEYTTSFLMGAEYILTWKVENFFPLLLLSLIFVPFQVAFEDILFRGVLLQAFGRFFGSSIIGILGTGILFGLLHLANPEITTLGWEVIFFYILMGIFFGIIAIMDNGLELNIGIHFINNFFLFTIITTDWQVMTTDAIIKDLSPPSFSIWSLIPLLLFQVATLFIFSKKYKWEKWTKLFHLT